MERDTGTNYIRHFKAVWRYKWLILLAMIITGGVALALSVNRPVMYRATTTIMIETTQSEFSLPFDLGFSNTKDFSSQIAIMGSKSVLENAIRQIEPDKADDPDWLEAEIALLQEYLRIEQESGTNLVYITVFSTRPGGLQAKADAVAAAYINEASIGRTAALNEAVEYATEQIKILSSSEIDITTSPSFPKFSVQMNNTLTALTQVSGYLSQLKAHESVANTLSVAALKNRINTEIDRIDRISELSTQLDSGLALIDIVESQATILESKIQDIRDELNALSQPDTGSGFYSELEGANSIMAQAAEAASNISTELYVLSRLIEREQYAPSGDDMEPVYTEAENAVSQEARVAGISLEIVMEMIPAISKITPQQLDFFSGKVSSAISTLRELTTRLNVTDTDQEILLTYTELAELENKVKLTVANILLLFQQVRDARLKETDSQVYQVLLNTEDLLTSANSASADLPDTVSSFAEFGGNGMNYNTLTSLQQEIQLALLTTSGDEISVVEPAILYNPEISFFSRYRNAGLAVFAILFLGVFAALVYQYIDKKVRDYARIADIVEVPLLARISRVSDKTKSVIPSVLHGGERHLLEDFRTLRTNLGIDQTKGTILLVSSPDAGEGKTVIAANLARVVALQGKKVLLIDGNLRNPDIAAAFGIEPSRGLDDVLSGTEDYQSCITQADDIDILTGRTRMEDSAELLSSPRMKILLEDARQIYDIILIDSYDLLPYADSLVLARMVDKVLIVIVQDVSRIDHIENSTRLLQGLGVTVTGCVLNKVKTKRTRQKSVKAEDD